MSKSFSKPLKYQGFSAIMYNVVLFSQIRDIKNRYPQAVKRKIKRGKK